jgi:deoxycytidine triphosphate deaminase
VNESVFSGCQSPIVNACDTMRAPGRSCLVSIGRNFRLDEESRYSVTTVAGDTSTVIASCCMKFTLPSTPAAFAFASDSLIRSGSMSTPTPVAPNF